MADKPLRKPPMIIQPLPIDGQEQTTFSTIRQGTATNKLTKIRAKLGENTTIDPVTGTALIVNGDLLVSVSNFGELEGFKTSTYKLFDALVVALTESGAKGPAITLSLDEYMAKCGLRDRKEARRQVKADLEILRVTSLSFQEKRRNCEPVGYYNMNISQGAGISRSGIITFTCSIDFYNHLLTYPVMPYPPLLWRTSAQKNPNSFFFLRRISEHKNMNVGKKNEDTIAVRTLIESSPCMIAYDEVMRGNRNLTARIIDPFERDMNALSDTLIWQYCHRNNAPLREEELARFSYEVFVGCLVRIQWHSYPDQTRRLARKAEAIAEAKRRKR